MPAVAWLPDRGASLPAWGWREESEATPQRLGWSSVPRERKLSWFCGGFGCKAVTKPQLGRDSWAWNKLKRRIIGLC